MELFDVVRLAVDLPGEGLRAGAVGAVVDIHEQPVAYEVEFTDTAGHTTALLALRPEQLQPVE